MGSNGSQLFGRAWWMPSLRMLVGCMLDACCMTQCRRGADCLYEDLTRDLQLQDNGAFTEGVWKEALTLITTGKPWPLSSAQKLEYVDLSRIHVHLFARDSFDTMALSIVVDEEGALW